MKNIFSISSSKIEQLAIGKFDGVHLAHQKLFKSLCSNAGVLMISQDKGCYLCDLELKKRLIGYELFELMLDEIREWSGEDFVAFLKQNFPNLKKIVVGYDFCFGKDRKNNCHHLQEMFDGEVEIIKEVKKNGCSIHTQNIKKILQEQGDIKLANLLLGRMYQIQGRVIKGQGIGKKMLYPTFNLDTQKYILPKEGVYATFVGEEKIPSATFIGVRSTDSHFSVEVHLLDKVRDFDKIDLFFVDRIRDNKHFSNLEELKKQITQDIQTIKNILKSNF